MDTAFLAEIAPRGSPLWEVVFFAKVVGAMLLGGVVGFERELANRPAGFRTHMFVAGASALLIRLGAPLLSTYHGLPVDELVEGDPFRTMGAVVTGIAFLGAGSIIQREGAMKVQGLTTAGSLLFSGAIGMATAMELWILAALLTAVVLIVLKTLGRFEDWALRKRPEIRE